MGEVARRLDVPRGTLLLTCCRSTAPPTARSPSSRASTTWPTRSRSPSTGAGRATEARRSDERPTWSSASTSARRARVRRRSTPTARSRRDATCRTRSPIPIPAGPSRTRASGSAPSPRRWPRCAATSAAGRCARSRSARSSTGWCRPAPTASRSGPALIWMDRRAGAECDAAADAASTRPGCASSRAATSIPATWPPRSPGCAAHAAEPARGRALVPAARARSSPGGRPASSRSIRRTRRRRCCSTSATRRWSERGVRGVRHRPGVAGAGAAGGRGARSGRARGCARPPGSTPRTLVVLGCGDEMAATLGAGVVEPGVVCDVMGTAEPVCAVAPTPALDPDGRHRAAPARRSRAAGCSRTRAGSRAAPTAGSATSWDRSRPRGRRPPAPTCTSC